MSPRHIPPTKKWKPEIRRTIYTADFDDNMKIFTTGTAHVTIIEDTANPTDIGRMVKENLNMVEDYFVCDSNGFEINDCSATEGTATLFFITAMAGYKL